MTGPAKRMLWTGAGVISLGLGLLGIPLPLLPTTPFLLLSVFCFARGSERLHDWLVHHPKFGPPIHEWRAHGAISRKAKVAAGIAMLAAFLIAFIAGAPKMALIAQIAVLCCVGLFLFTRPEPPTE